MKTVADLGESGLLAKIFKRFSRQRSAGLVLGPGDDAALARLRPGRLLVVTQDDLAEGTHFETRWTDFSRLAHKLIRVNLSDLAAMGAVEPTGVVVSAGFPANAPARWAEDFLKGLSAEARRFKVPVLGGNLCRSKKVFFTLTALGEAKKGGILTRSGGRAGDLLAGFGPLGAAANGLKDLRRGIRTGRWVRYFWEPEPQFRAARILAQRGLATALMDNSDGLSRSCRILAEESGLGYQMEIDRLSCAGDPDAGEDYGLVFSVPPGRWKALVKALPGAYRVGHLVRSGRGRSGRREGFDQFRRNDER